MPYLTYRRKTPVTLLAASIAVALQFSAAAMAQDAATPAPQQDPAVPSSSVDTLDAVMVTGYRASLEKALEIKRGEAGVVDAIVAEDVANFPDLNLAESLQRIPGVSIDRDAGEGKSICVRGLSPQFTRVRINGMEAMSTGGGTDSSGGVNRGRGFDFNTFASELFSQIVVRKTSSADVEEGSLGATVDLRAARPFDYDGFTFVAGGQMGYNDLSSTANPRASALISNTWMDGRFGALLSVAYTDRELVEEGHSTVRWDPGTANGGFSGTPAAESTSVFHPRIPRYGIMRHDQERLGATGSLQFKASDDTRFALDVLYATFDADRTEDYIEAVSFSRTAAQGGKPQTVVVDSVIDSRGNLVYGVFDNVDVRSESRTDEQSTEFLQWGFSADHDFSDAFRMKALIGQSKSTYDNPVQTTLIMDKNDADGYSWDYRRNNRLPVFNYGTADVMDPNGWTLAEIRLRPQWVENEFDNAQLDFDWDISASFGLKFGANYKDYTYTSREWRRSSESVPGTLVPSSQLAGLLTTSGLRGINVDGNANRWLIPDVRALNNLLDFYTNSGIYTVYDNLTGIAANNRSVNEKDSGVYVQADFSVDLGPVPLSGNVGVRYVKTELTSDGWSFPGGVATPTRVEHEYSDTLPSFNLVAELTPEFLVRLSAAEVMARPGLGFLNPGATVSVAGGSRTVTTGNPRLNPFRADTVDLSFEWYFAEESLLSLGLFYKNIDSYIQTSSEIRPFNTSGLPDSLLAGTNTLPTDEFNFVQPLNTPGDELKGVEVSYQQPFTFLPGLWSNFGTQLNYTYVQSDIQYLNSNGTPSAKGPMLGLSKNAYNATLYYEGDHFSARVSAAYRSEFLTTIPGRNSNNVEGTKATTTVDASISYKFDEHLEISLEGLNLTDEWNDQWVDSVGDRSSVYTHTGRQYMMGLRYKF